MILWDDVGGRTESFLLFYFGNDNEEDSEKEERIESHMQTLDKRNLL